MPKPRRQRSASSCKASTENPLYRKSFRRTIFVCKIDLLSFPKKRSRPPSVDSKSIRWTLFAKYNLLGFPKKGSRPRPRPFTPLCVIRRLPKPRRQSSARSTWKASCASQVLRRAQSQLLTGAYSQLLSRALSQLLMRARAPQQEPGW